MFRLVKKKDELDWVHINTERLGCRSHLGRKGRKQQIIAGACLDPDTGGNWGKLLHEWMHVLGMSYLVFTIHKPLMINCLYDLTS